MCSIGGPETGYSGWGHCPEAATDDIHDLAAAIYLPNSALAQLQNRIRVERHRRTTERIQKHPHPQRTHPACAFMKLDATPSFLSSRSNIEHAILVVSTPLVSNLRH